MHRHLDWQSALDWIGSEPFLVAEEDGQLVAALASPADTQEAIWIRLFACSSETKPEEAWDTLWPAAYQQAMRIRQESVSAIALHGWFGKLLTDSGFGIVNQVVVLQWDQQAIPPVHKKPPGKIRDMRTGDLQAVEELDHLAFKPLWQNSRESLEIALKQAALARVIDADGRILAYQISTATQLGGHLARLATRPEYQGRGLGYSLLYDLLLQFKRRGAQRITVNTQQDNFISLALYQKLGFVETGESFPVYQYPLER